MSVDRDLSAFVVDYSVDSLNAMRLFMRRINDRRCLLLYLQRTQFYPLMPSEGMWILIVAYILSILIQKGLLITFDVQ